MEQAYAVDVFDLAERAEDAKLIVRGERFYEAETLEGALNTFREAMAVHLRRLLSRVARLLSDGKQSGLSARRLQGSVCLSWTMSR